MAKMYVGPAGDQLGDPQEAIDALDRHQPGDERHERNAFGHAQFQTDGLRAGRVLLALNLKRRQIEAERDHLDAVSRRDAQAHEIIRHLIGDRHDLRAATAETTLDASEDR